MLKQLIQRLLDSRTTPAQAGHSAMPSSAPTTISSPTSITSWGTITTFTAPDDGYVTFHGRSMAGAAAQIASLPLENNPTVITATQDNYQGMSCNLPVVKGKTVEVYGSNIENIVVSFNRLIGGGCKRIVWRALSCLRALSNYLSKPSSKVKNRGLVCRDFRQLRRHSYPQQWTQHGELMSLQQTVMSFLVAAHRNVSCTTRWVPALIMGAPRVSLEDLSRFGKVALCTITLKARTALLDSPLLHVSLSKLEKGGALC